MYGNWVSFGARWGQIHDHSDQVNTRVVAPEALMGRITESARLRLAAAAGDCPAQPLLLQGQPERAAQGCVQSEFDYLQG